MAVITEHENEQIKEANASGKTPIVFVHGLWLLPSSWDRWRAVFEDAGFTTLSPGWPDDPNTVEEAKQHPEVFAHKTIGQIADHFEDVIGKLKKRPALDRSLVRRAARADPRGPGRVRRRPSPSTPRRSAGCCRFRSRRSSRPRRCSATRRTTAARFRSPTSSSATRSPTR